MAHVHQSQILITELAHLHEAYRYAEEKGCAAQFATSFVRLLFIIAADVKDVEQAGRVTYGHVGSDFAPYSFRFHFGSLRSGQQPEQMTRGDGFHMNGGLIYHGPADDGSGGMPALSVMIGRNAKENPHQWSIHT